MSLQSALQVMPLTFNLTVCRVWRIAGGCFVGVCAILVMVQAKLNTKQKRKALKYLDFILLILSDCQESVLLCNYDLQGNQFLSLGCSGNA